VRTTYLVVIGVAAAAAAIAATALAGRGGPASPIEDASFTTVFASTLGLEGLAGDAEGNLYSTGRNADPCPVYRVAATGGTAVVVGNVPAPCSPSGIAFGPDGRLYVADDDQILVLAPNAAAPPHATVYASSVPGTNGLAFDRAGNLWTGDGTTGQGRVWRVDRNGVPTEAFRIQPMANGLGVGREARTLPPGTAQGLVANGVAFDHDGSLIVADTARGALWRVELDRAGNVLAPTGCDSTFATDTLCLDNIWVQHVSLEGADGIALDRAGNVWTAANERNAIVVVGANGEVTEFFRNPANVTTMLRNGGPLEFPTSPFLLGHTLCVTSSDGNRRDNSPNSAGEVRPGSPAVAKISCLDQRLPVPGLEVPVR
jgi:sugar lactone lactonase YvrE